MDQKQDPFVLYDISPVISACQDMMTLPFALGTAWWNITTGWAKPTEVRATTKPGPIEVPDPIEEHDERNLFA